MEAIIVPETRYIPRRIIKGLIAAYFVLEVWNSTPEKSNYRNYYNLIRI
jgi:hypothetical protein